MRCISLPIPNRNNTHAVLVAACATHVPGCIGPPLRGGLAGRSARQRGSARGPASPLAQIRAHQRQGVQYVDAWGKKLSGSVSQTKRSYTGQYLDDSGLLFYNARYYDPGIGRFVSADSIVPGNASGGMAGIAYKPLTVDVHEPGFVATVNHENQFGLALVPTYSCRSVLYSCPSRM